MSKDGMRYEATTINNKPNGKKVLLKEIDRLSTASIIWFLVRRHKTGLLATWAITVTMLYIFPPLPQLLLGLINL